MSTSRAAKIELVLFYIWTFLAAFTLAAQVFFGSSAPKRTDHDRTGAVASENKICSQIGIDLIEAGGNAADALVGTTLCVGVIGMYHSGIGGGGFALIRAPNGTYEAIDFRETAPAAAFEDMYKDHVEGSVFGGLASGIPGEVRGLEYIHRHYGVLPWADVVTPAVKVARDGFVVSHDLVRFMGFATQDYDFLVQDQNWATDFAPNGTRLGLGDIIYRKRYADTLEKLALQGADAFYTGPMAESTKKAVQATNGTMTAEDLRDYAVVSRPAIEITYRRFNVYGCGAPASGAVALNVLKTLEGYEDFGKPEMLNLSTHRLDEAFRFGYGKRTELGDPDFLDGLYEFEADMIDVNSAAAIRARISDHHTQNVSAYDPNGFESAETHGTSHVVTADASGLATSLTTTINLLFGSRVLVPETGIIMNNEMNDFSIPHIRNAFGYVPTPANYIRPGKRSLSSITPLIVEHSSDHSLFAVLGAAGGSRIITATIQNALDVIDRNMTAHEALARPRLHDQLVPNQAFFEWEYDNSTVHFMKGRGHNVTWVPPLYSSAQALKVSPNGSFEAAGEPRQKDSAGLTV